MLELWWIYKHICFIDVINRLAYAYRKCYVLLLIPQVNGTKTTWIWPGYFNDQISILASKGLRHKNVCEIMIIGMCRFTLPIYNCGKNKCYQIYYIHRSLQNCLTIIVKKRIVLMFHLKYNITYTQIAFIWISWFPLRSLLPWQLFMMWYIFIKKGTLQYP